MERERDREQPNRNDQGGQGQQRGGRQNMPSEREPDQDNRQGQSGGQGGGQRDDDRGGMKKKK